MEVRDPIDVHKTETIDERTMTSSRESDECLQRTLQAASFIKLVHNQLHYLKTLSLGEELMGNINQFKILAKSHALDLYIKSREALWYRQLFLSPDIKNNDDIAWHSLSAYDTLSCIYQGEKYTHRELVDEYLKLPDLFCVQISLSDPRAMLIRLHEKSFCVVVFPTLSVRLYINQEQAITACLQNIGMDAPYKITCYFEI